MVFEKKLLALILITVIVVSGIILGFFQPLPDLFRYIIAIFGQCLIVFMSVSIGFDQAKSFTLKSSIGKSLMFISLGILTWGIGNLFWLYYNVVSQIEVPFPSLADVGFLGMIPFAFYGLLLLLKSIKTEFDSKTVLKLAIMPVIVFLITYWLFIQSKLAENVTLLIKILNVAYPMGDIIFLSFALMILTLIRGGKMFKPIGIICIGLIIEAMADFSFSWTTSAGTYYTGSFVDLLFALAFFTLGLGIYYTKELQNRPLF